MPELDAPAPAPLDLTRAEDASRLALLIGTATRADGQPPFSDQALVEVRSGVRSGSTVEFDGMIAGVSIRTASSPFEAEFVVAPRARHHGLGEALLADILAQAGGDVRIWAHGDHPDARALAHRHGLVPVRELLQLRLTPVVAPVAIPGRAADVAAFRPGIDDAEWLAINAAAFADHAEQGGMTQADLDARMAEDWFDAGDFLIARGGDGAMTGFCWLKIEAGAGVDAGDDDADDDAVGEFYAVGVSPAAQGTGLGRALVNAGLARLVERDIRSSHLYVEGDNTAAVSLYRSVGFTDHSIDIQYASRGA
ncbi:MAG: mycothiol synthase [Burkholderiaceae bacterium]|nr:mycothiol synthase [Microbacteriaceae bacterium]